MAIHPLYTADENFRDKTYNQGFAGNLKFPLREDEIYDGRIRFVVYEAQPLSINLFKALEKVDTVDNKKQASDIPPGDVQGQILVTEHEEESKNLAKSLYQGVSYNISTNAPKVEMYFPFSLQIQDGVQYSNADLGAVGAGALGAIEQGQSLLASAYRGIADGVSNVFEFAKGNLAGEAARLGALRAARVLPSGIQNAVSIGVQRTLNPNTRALFNGVNLREFSFTFKMIAESREEAEEIQKIVRHFRTELYPDVIAPGGIPVGFKFPNAFGIQFRYKGAQAKIPKLEKCFLRNISTVYNSTSPTFHSDGHPNEVDLTLSFVEFRTLNKNDVSGGEY